jgi:hypothetical protein
MWINRDSRGIGTTQGPPPQAAEPLSGAPEAAPALVAEAPKLVGDDSLRSRWPDVIEHVKSRNPILASLLGSAQPLRLDDKALVVAFASEFNRKSAESRTHRQLIETAFERVYGTAYVLRGTVGNGSDDTPNLLDDPVINFAQRTFGGQPQRVTTD